MVDELEQELEQELEPDHYLGDFSGYVKHTFFLPTPQNVKSETLVP